MPAIDAEVKTVPPAAGCGPRAARWLGTLFVATLLTVSSAPPARSVPADPQEREEVEQRVRELEQQFEHARDEALEGCRRRWSQCTSVECKQIPESEQARWNACREHCDEGLAACNTNARAIWPEGANNSAPGSR